MENFNKFYAEFAYDTRQDVQEMKAYLTAINHCFDGDSRNFCNLVYYVYKVNELFKQYYYFNKKRELYTFKGIMSQFGLSQSDTSRLCACYSKYLCFDTVENSGDQCPRIIEEFKGFSKSKLFELLPVPTDQLFLDIAHKVLRPEMTVQVIRKYVKNWQNQQDLKNPTSDEEETSQDEEIPMAYDPTQHYDFDYFKDKTKAQLLNIVWSLQTEYEKLKEKKQKNGK